ncbi:SDR family NAD(P)-dependent oxidoreductase [Streptomyces sp. NPDC004610]|uniref:SDR family NAD(P)-dependent oxidoreductase n=1 Tax=unclassified Streptomyces TaxID=2593676 RepID=UPI0033B6DAE7
MTDTALESWLRRRVAELAGRPAGEISLHEPLISYGLTSADAIALAGELSVLLGRAVPPTLAYEHPTLREIVGHLQDRAHPRTTAADPAARTAGGAVPSDPTGSDPVAVVGLGCRFPGADGPDAFWELLADGRDAIGTVPDDRFTHHDRRGDGGTARARLGGFLTGVGALDADFFGIGAHEAAALDPQQMLVLEVAWEALEDAGVAPDTLAGSATGVFIGISSSDHREAQAATPAPDAYTLLGSASSVAANRLSYLLDLRGPSLAVDTACSSSLVAVHLACEALRRGECTMAVVGGVNVILSPVITEAFDASGVMAPDGRCKPFSDRADGYVRSEGAGVVVLKPLRDAVRDGDRISAVIRGTAVTSNGRTNGLLAPGRGAQEEVVRRALLRAGIEPRRVGYVETHGTGTAVGDRIEALALGEVLGADRDPGRPCAIGSVKSNLGHLEAAAGVAGLIKVALSLEHRALPPSLHCERPSPDIDFPGLGLRVQTALTPWTGAGAGLVPPGGDGLVAGGGGLVADGGGLGAGGGGLVADGGGLVAGGGGLVADGGGLVAGGDGLMADGDGLVAGGDGLVAGVSSFGFGGTNAHVVLTAAPEVPGRPDVPERPEVPVGLGGLERPGGRAAAPGAEAAEPAPAPALAPTPPNRPVRLLTLSAATEDALRAQAADWADWAEAHSDDDLGPGLAATALLRGGTGVRSRRVRAAFAFGVKDELLARLRGPLTPAPVVPETAPGVVFVFPGQGAQWTGMGRALLEREPAFDLAVSRCEQAFAPYVPWSLREVLRGEGEVPLESVDVVQPALFALQTGLAAVFRSWGVRPAGVLGHSMGEVAAAYVSGALRLEDAARVVCRRSALLSRHRGEGAMALVSLPAQEVRRLLEPFGGRLSCAAHNGPRTTVVSGRTDAVTEFLAARVAEGVFCRRVEVDVASHSPVLDGLREELLADLAGLSPRETDVPFHSSVAGGPLATGGLDAGYWWRNLREPVLFADAVRATGPAGGHVFLELSPHPLLSASVTECLAEPGDRRVLAVPAMRRDDERAVHEALGTLFEAGCAIEWRTYLGERAGGGPRLPSYPWQRRTPAAAFSRAAAGETVVTGSLPVLRDHRVRGRATAPAAWMLDAALHALGRGRAEPDALSGAGAPSGLTGPEKPNGPGSGVDPGTYTGPGRVGVGAGARPVAALRHRLDDILVTAPLAVADGRSRLVRVSRRSRPGGPPVLSVESRAADEPDGLWEEHLRAGWSESPQPPPPADLSALRARCPHAVDPAVLYGQLAASGLEYGDVLRTVTVLWRGDGEALARLGAPSAGTRGRPLPADVADGAMQTIGALTLDTPIPGTFVGFAYRRVEVFAEWTGPVYAHVRLCEAPRPGPEHTEAAPPGADSFEADVQIVDPDGRVLARFTGAALKRLREEPHSLRRFAVGLTPRPRPAQQPAPAGDFLLLTDDPEGCAPLLEELRNTGADCAAQPYPDAMDATDLLRSRPPSTRLVCVAPERETFLSLVRAAADVLPAERRELSVVTADPALPPLLRALAEETGRWTGRALLTDTDAAPTHELARDLAAELTLSTATSFSVRFRHGERLVPTLTPLAPESADPGAMTGLRPGGVYWITGGQGGLGAALAVALAREAGARVVVSGRRAEPDEGLRESVEAAGGRLLHLRADAADTEATRRALNEILRHFGTLHGVIHTAGVLKDTLLRSATAEDLRTVLRPKETGARVLLDTVAGEDLDFVVLFSSLAALFVTPGQGGYAAANAALDALATTGPGGRTPVRTVNWGPWAQVGMVADDSHRRRFLASGIHPILPDDGVRAFLRLLGGAHRQLAVVDVEDGAVDELLAAFNRPPGTPRPGGPRPGGLHPAVPARDGGSTAAFVRAELARALRLPVDAIDGTARLDRLGVDSLLAVAVTRAIGGHFGLDLPATLMFTHQTLDDLVHHLDGLLAEETGDTEHTGGTGDTGPARGTDDGIDHGTDHGTDHDGHPPAEAPPTPGAPPHSLVPGYTVTGTGSGAAPGLTLTEVSVPAPGPGEVVVDVHAVGVNFIDVLASSGLHPFLSGSGTSFVPGHEVAGVVHEVGAEVTGIRPGDAVVALTPRGGYAARVTTPSFTVRPIPAGLPFTDAASLLISGLTAIACLEREAHLREGDHVLVQAAAGATGTACVQLARHHGAVVYGTASTPAKLTRLRALGVRHPIDYTARDFADAVRDVAPERGLDVIVDSLSGDAVSRGLGLLRPGGRFIEIGAAGVLELPLDAAKLFLSSRSFSTVNLGALARDPAVLGPLLDRLDALVEAQVLCPAVADVLPFEDLPEALTRLRNRANIGKYVVRVR